jgi:transposase
MRALDLEREGRTQREIAAILDVTEAAVSKWLAAARLGGKKALRSRPAPGPAPKIADEQLRMVPDLLSHGAEAHGFSGDVWNCERVAGVIYQEFGAAYSTSQVSRLLKHLRWTPQIPISRAIQRDEEAIERWRTESWLALKEEARREHRDLIFVDESGFYLLPGRVKTYAPKGETPILDEWQTRDHLAVRGG